MTPIDTLTLGETKGSFSLVLSPLATLTFDKAGRPLGLYEKGFYVAHGLDGRCLEKKWVWEGAPQARRHLRELPPPERDEIRRRCLELLTVAQQYLPDVARRGSLARFRHGRAQTPSAQEASRLLEFLSRFVKDQWNEDIERFNRLWHPIGILPPDQYLALVIQVVEGCAWNQCTFCDFYAHRPFRVRTIDQIRQHTDEAVSFFGPALSGRCSIFLGDANAFQAPPALLIPLAQELAGRFPALATAQPDGVGGLYAFAEAARLSAWTVPQLKAMAQAGLRRVYLGVETGWDPLRQSLRKPGSGETVLTALAKLKEAGIHLGLIVLLGAGGREQAADHVRETAALIRKALLGPGDMVYFSPLVLAEGSPYALEAARQGWTLLTVQELQSQRKEMEALVPPRGERRATYDIQEFIY